MRRILVGLWVLLLALWLVPGLLAQDGSPGLGQKVDAALVLAGPVFAVIQWLAGQALKYVFKDSDVSTETIMRVLTVFTGALLFLGFGLGYDVQINTGITWLNDVSGAVQQVLLLVINLLTMIFGSKGLYEGAKARNVPVLGAKQGDVAFGYARDQDVWDRRAA